MHKLRRSEKVFDLCGSSVLEMDQCEAQVPFEQEKKGIQQVFWCVSVSKQQHQQRQEKI